MFGREVRAPVDNVYGSPKTALKYTYYDYADELQHRLKVFTFMRGSICGRWLEEISATTRCVAGRGNTVLATRFTTTNHGNMLVARTKWSRKFSGPFLVVAVIGPANLKLQRSRGAKPFVTHVETVKPYVAEMLPKSWIDEPAAEAKQPSAGDANKDDNGVSTSMEAVAGMPPLLHYWTPRPQWERRQPRRFLE